MTNQQQIIRIGRGMKFHLAPVGVASPYCGLSNTHPQWVFPVDMTVAEAKASGCLCSKCARYAHS